MYSSIVSNKRKTVIIFTFFIMIISAIGLLFSFAYDNISIFFLAMFGAAIYAAVEYYFSSKIAIAMSGATEITRAQAPEFYAAVESISITAGIPMPKTYLINDPSPNAFAAGKNPENSIVCATTGLLEIMDKAELEGVVAHEISHIKNYDIRVSMAAFALTAAIGFLADIAWRIIFWSDNDDSKNPIAMIIGIIIAMLSPLIASIVQLAISRQREYLADASAIELTRYPEGLIGALEKLKTAKPMQKQSSSMSNLYINDPLKKSFLSKIMSTHPPLEERINRLKENSNKL